MLGSRPGDACEMLREDDGETCSSCEALTLPKAKARTEEAAAEAEERAQKSPYLNRQTTGEPQEETP
jgi:hypothetical protein